MKVEHRIMSIGRAVKEARGNYLHDTEAAVDREFLYDALIAERRAHAAARKTLRAVEARLRRTRKLAGL